MPGRTPASSASALPSATATPTPITVPSPTVTPLGPNSTLTGTGSVTWTSITTTRTLCPDIRNQLGSSYSLTVSLKAQGSGVILTLDHHDDTPGTYLGTLAGSSIRAAYQGPFGGLACPSDASPTPQTSGNLVATLSANAINGQYTEVYGTGADAVTFGFEFQAHLSAQ
ncbi:MAG TPA: hypothetical protein VH854_08700 [Thermoanaerobaculia bacterium]|nr:hypothetical protein [Thermoanaerobaculia bacterium]